LISKPGDAAGASSSKAQPDQPAEVHSFQQKLLLAAAAARMAANRLIDTLALPTEHTRSSTVGGAIFSRGFMLRKSVAPASLTGIEARSGPVLEQAIGFARPIFRKFCARKQPSYILQVKKPISDAEEEISTNNGMHFTETTERIFAAFQDPVT